MPSSRYGIEFIEANQAEAHTYHNRGVVTIDTAINCQLESRTTTTPPGTGSVFLGMAYHVPSGASGDWAGMGGKIAVWQSGWLFFTPPDGMVVQIKNEGYAYYIYEGGGWQGIGVRNSGWANHRLTSSGLDRWWPAGMDEQNCTALTTGVVPKDIIHAMPFMSDRGGNIYGVGVNFTTLSNLTFYNLGIYRATSVNDIYPAELVWDSGSIGSPGVTGATTQFPSAKYVRPGLVHWMVFACAAGATSPTLRCLQLANTRATLGYDNTFGTAAGYGLQTSISHTGSGYALPTTFPGGATVKTTTPVPAIFYRF